MCVCSGGLYPKVHSSRGFSDDRRYPKMHSGGGGEAGAWGGGGEGTGNTPSCILKGIHRGVGREKAEWYWGWVP